jgi:hypothetical protein
LSVKDRGDFGSFERSAKDLFASNMKTRLLTLVVLGAVMLGISACTTSPKIQYDAVEGYDFDKAQTYAIIETKGKTQIEVGPGTVQAVYQAMHDSLDALGLTEAPAADADLLVVAHLQMTDKVDVTNWGYGYGGYSGYGYYGGGYGGMGMSGGTTTTEYKDATLAIDIVDNVEDVLVWRGWASKNIYGDTKGSLNEKERENLKATLRNILANFPPPPTPEG